jgi:hypothetical protein
VLVELWTALLDVFFAFGWLWLAIAAAELLFWLIYWRAKGPPCDL